MEFYLPSTLHLHHKSNYSEIIEYIYIVKGTDTVHIYSNITQ